MRKIQIVLVLLVVILLSGSGYAESDRFFEGKTIRMIVPYGPGGGFDTYARMIKPFLEKYLPGSTVMVDNVEGAGGELGRNLAYIAKSDGLTVCLTAGVDMVFNTIVGTEGVKYDINKWTYLARLTVESSVLTVPADSEYLSFNDLMISKKRLLFSVDGIGDADYFTLAIIAHIFGFDILPVTGYAGNKEASMAAVRGEVDLWQSGIGTALPLIQNGDIRPLLLYGTQRNPEIPDVPTVLEMMNTEKFQLSETQKNIIRAVIQADEVRRVIIAPPGLDENIKTILRQAIYKALHDPELIDISKQLNRPIVYLGGEEITQLIKETMEIRDLLKPIMLNALELAQ